jgi:hypothetical protein
MCKSFKRPRFASSPPNTTRVVPTRVTDWPPRETCSGWNLHNEYTLLYIISQFSIWQGFSSFINLRVFVAPEWRFLSSQHARVNYRNNKVRHGHELVLYFGFWCKR